MTERTTNGAKRNWVLVPLFGVILFVVTYIIATLLYPGGSQADSESKGFSWLHNYWCNLLNEKAINGEYNSARPVAITGMIILCISMAVFWHQFAKWINPGPPGRQIMQFSGIASMCSALFIFTRYHDIIINVTSLLAILALVGTYSGLYKKGWRNLFWVGIFNLVLMGINNFIYYTGKQIYYLPIVQKITFCFVLVWICLIVIKLYRYNRQK